MVLFQQAEGWYGYLFVAAHGFVEAEGGVAAVLVAQAAVGVAGIPFAVIALRSGAVGIQVDEAGGEERPRCQYVVNVVRRNAGNFRIVCHGVLQGEAGFFRLVIGQPDQDIGIFAQGIAHGIAVGQVGQVAVGFYVGVQVGPLVVVALSQEQQGLDDARLAGTVHSRYQCQSAQRQSQFVEAFEVLQVYVFQHYFVSSCCFR